MKCNNCGREIDNGSKFCNYCGACQTPYPEAKELPPEEQPELFKCVKCGRPLPVGIDQCIYCKYIYQGTYAQKMKAEQHTGILGNKGLKCPKCASDNIRIENDIPVATKIKELFLIGAIMPQTKAKYRKDMIYHCASCGYAWKED